MREEKKVMPELPEETLRLRAIGAAGNAETLFAVSGELYHLIGVLRKEIQALEDDETELQPVRVTCSGCDGTHQLARAISDFADWQFRGYEGWKEDVRQDVGRQLWFTVSDLVCRTTGDTLATPGFGST